MNRSISIHYPDGIHGYGIEFTGLTTSGNGFSYGGIKAYTEKYCPSCLGHFYQGGFAIPESSNGWAFLECWDAKNNPDEFLNFVMMLSYHYLIPVS